MKEKNEEIDLGPNEKISALELTKKKRSRQSYEFARNLRKF
jgi:hypothetical protein